MTDGWMLCEVVEGAERDQKLKYATDAMPAMWQFSELLTTIRRNINAHTRKRK